MRTLSIVILAWLSFPAFSQVHEFVLSNGLKVLVKEDHRAPVAVSMVWYNVGSADEPGGITGVSHALEHIMFKGTPTYPKGVFSKIIASNGGQENAFTNHDYTAYFEKISVSRLPVAFKLEADRMRNLLLDPAEFAKEIKVIREERRLRTEDNPQALTLERFLAAAHLISPYHHPVIGWMSDLNQLTVQDLAKWYKQYYAPNNATLVVVGDVKAEKIHQLAQTYFGPIGKSQLPERKPQLEPPALGKKAIQVEGPAKLPMLMLGYTVPSLQTGKTSVSPYVLALIAGILSADDSGRFSKELIREKHIASSIDIYYNPFARYQTQFIIYGVPTQDHTIEALRAAIKEQLNALKTKAIPPEELQRIKTQVIAEKTFEKDSIFEQAMELGLLETVGIGWQEAEKFTDRINQVTAQQIQETATRYFQEGALTEAELIPLAQPERHS